MAFAVGNLIDGRYELVEPLGGSTAGEVFRALDRPLNREVAIRLAGLGDPAAAAALARQARWMTAVQYDSLNVVAVFGDGMTPDGVQYVVMDLVRGLPLDERRAPVPADQAIGLAIELLDAALAMRRHANERVSIVPATALLTGDGHARVVRFAEAAPEGAGQPDPMCTAVAGTLRELLGSPRSDPATPGEEASAAVTEIIDGVLAGRVRAPDDLRARLRAARRSPQSPAPPPPPPHRLWPLVFATILILGVAAIVVALLVVAGTS